ncbi:MAG TPA: 2-C-methyl-D-erythritol 4-phosphate cytidylyltransferase [Micromonosporaceae bacterium]
MTTPPAAVGDVAILVPAAGAGVRMGPGAPKALRELAGTPLLVHAVRRMAMAPSVGLIVVAAPAADVAGVAAMLADIDRCEVVAGGATRQLSVAAALRVVPAAYDMILVHDAARALAPPDLVESVAAAVRAGAVAVIPVLPVVDTIKRVGADGEVLATVDRTPLRAVQTPQGFRRKTLVEAHERAVDTHTDDAGMVEAMGVRVDSVLGSDRAFKITRPFDLVLAEALLALDATEGELGSN